MIIPNGTGTTNDLLGRKLAQELNSQFRIEVIIENHPGADQLLGLARANNATHPVLVISGSTLHVFKPVLDPQSMIGIDQSLDVFATIAQGAALWYTNPNSQFKTISDVLRALESNQSINIGTELLVLRANVASVKHHYRATNTTIVPYKSSPQTVIDVANNQIPLALSSYGPAMASLIEQGRILPLANTSKQPLRMFDRDIPPMGIHVPQFPIAWFVATTRKNPVDRAVIEAVHAVLKSPQMQQYITGLGLITVSNNRASTERFIQEYRSTLQTLSHTISLN